MLPYITVFILVSLFGGILDIQKNRFFKLFFTLLIVFSFSSLYYLRDIGIGADTSTYIWHFESIIESRNMLEYAFTSQIEIGFIFLVKFLGIINSNPFFIFWGISLIIYFNCLYSIKNFNISYGLFCSSLFSVYPIYLFSFNIVRQSLAVSFVFLAVSFLVKNDNKKFFLFILIASIFHYSSILCIFIYFLYKYKNFILKFWYALVFIFYTFIILFYKILLSNHEKYNEAYSGLDGVSTRPGIFISIFYISIFALSIIFKDKIFKNKENFKIYLVIYLVYCTFYLIFYTLPINQGVVRMSWYFMWGVIPLIMLILSSVKNANIRVFVCLFYWLFVFVFFVFILSNSNSYVVPFIMR